MQTQLPNAKMCGRARRRPGRGGIPKILDPSQPKPEPRLTPIPPTIVGTTCIK